MEPTISAQQLFLLFFFLTLLSLFACFWLQVTQLRYVSSAELIIEVIFLELIHFTRIWKSQEKILNSTLQLLMQSEIQKVQDCTQTQTKTSLFSRCHFLSANVYF